MLKGFGANEYFFIYVTGWWVVLLWLSITVSITEDSDKVSRRNYLTFAKKLNYFMVFIVLSGTIGFISISYQTLRASSMLCVLYSNPKPQSASTTKIIEWKKLLFHHLCAQNLVSWWRNCFGHLLTGTVWNKNNDDCKYAWLRVWLAHI